MRRKILKVLSSFIIFFGFCSNIVVPISAYKQLIETPYLGFVDCLCQLKDVSGNSLNLTDEDTAVEFMLTQKDQNLNICFNKPSCTLPHKEDDEIYFVQVEDFLTKKPLSYAILNKYTDTEYNWDYADGWETSLNLPYYCDSVNINIYKQKKTELLYDIKKDNLVGTTRYFMVGNSGFIRFPKKTLTVLNKNGTAISDPSKNNPANLLVSNIPNHYILSFPGMYYMRKIGKIILPSSQENLLSESEKIVACGVQPSCAEKSPEKKDSYTEPKNCFYLYIPKEVKNFKFQIFDSYVTDNKDDILCQFDVNLEK